MPVQLGSISRYGRVLLTVGALGWMEGGDQSCIECEMESVAWVKVVGLAVGLVVACLLLIASYLCYQKMAARGAKKDAGTLRSAPCALSSSVVSLTGPTQRSARVAQHNSTQARDRTAVSITRSIGG